MLSNKQLMSTHSCAVNVTIFSNNSIIMTGFKSTYLHALTLAARSSALLIYRAAACDVTGGMASLNFDAYRAANFLR